MMLYGQVTGMNGNGVYVRVDALRAEYGPLPYTGKTEDYPQGARVLVSQVGTNGDEYIVLGHVLP